MCYSGQCQAPTCGCVGYVHALGRQGVSQAGAWKICRIVIYADPAMFGAWYLCHHLMILTGLVWTLLGGWFGILLSLRALLVMVCCGQVEYCEDIT